MSELVKGNFKLKEEVKDESTGAIETSLEGQFEREALKKLGGSIAFVSKRKVVWDERDLAGTNKNEK